MKEKLITRRSLSDRRAGKTEWARLDEMTDEEIEANAASDADNPQWTEEQLEAARLALPDDRTKVAISIRLEPEVIEYFKSQGPGYQTRVNAVLKAYVRSMRKKKSASTTGTQNAGIKRTEGSS